MTKTILLTGATDGIGLATAKMLAAEGHTLLLHGRSQDKLDRVVKELAEINPNQNIATYVADLSQLSDVEALAKAVAADYAHLDVLINNAGVYKTHDTTTADGLDVRFVVNTIAPYLLFKELRPQLGKGARVVNLSSAAQAPVDLNAFAGQGRLSHDSAYAQSKLALTMWSFALARSMQESGLVIVAVNPGSLLASKMVKDAFGVPGSDIRIGADILVRAALSDEFATANGRYFDNDAKMFASPHPDALDAAKSDQIVQAIENILAG